MGEKIKLFIGHYHLHPCGVTRIIHSQLTSAAFIKSVKEIFILSSCDSEITKLNQKVIKYPNLDYLNIDISKEESFKRGAELLFFFRSKISKSDIIHFHNHNLGKNPLLSITLFKLAKEGYPIVFHCHDFAEDRAENFNFMKKIIQDYYDLDLKKVMYPYYNNCFYITLQSYDYKRLINYGLNKNRIRIISNPVCFNDNIIKDKKDSREIVFKKLEIQNDLPIFLYPVRVIKRKNIGEFILFAALFNDQAHWMVTLPPKNPIEIVEYQRWKTFCKENNIKVYFEISEKIDFITSMNAADKIITTSVKEGFGMSYLEPWLFNKPVIGRDIDTITKDFKGNNIKMDGLYSLINVSEDIDLKVDFANLKIEGQMKIIKTVLSDEKIKNRIITKNNLKKFFFSSIRDDLIEYNKSVIKDKYSIKKFGESLNEIYEKISE